MAENIQSLKKRIKSSSSIAQIAKAMEMVSAVKIRKAQKAVEQKKPFAAKVLALAEHLAADKETKKLQNPFLEKRQSSKKLIIALSPDKGLCGGLPAMLAKKLTEHPAVVTPVVTVGKKIESLASRLGYNILASFHLGSAFPDYSVVYPVMKVIREKYLSNAVGEVWVLYADFISIVEQRPKMLKLLPIELSKKDASQERFYTYEPNIETVLNEFIPYYIETCLYDAFLESYASEQGARMVAMQNAKDNASEIKESLTLYYNRVRQEKITNELLDLTNGMMA